MSVSEKFDLKTTYLENARLARRNARLGKTQHRELWKVIALHWETLAQLHSERCACGAPAIGTMVGPDGVRSPRCHKHWNGNIAQDNRAAKDSPKR